ncbi:transcriptional regulator [Streptomyces sp. LHD-70]|uniref:transcriptional regulator n=1 Tax=Streptomyces sp. LHD-70 TaxID=3072140 RepID=UPI00280D250F|nr:transcriptional regulator [Streptomyces sp. LHD-70]MDQ8707544.1 transcriptional regulator [Streptomyces sp. LHD-70]
MPEHTQDFGKFGARGIRGSHAVARQLDQLAGGIATPITAQRGLQARLAYLTCTEHARSAAREAGLTVTDRTLKAWQDGKRRPSKKNLARIEAAYTVVRRRNVARYLLGWLNRSGRGTRVEIHPINQSQVPRPFQRVAEYRSLNIHRWDRVVQAWEEEDGQALDEAWTDHLVDLGSQWGQYEYVTNVGFAA